MINELNINDRSCPRDTSELNDLHSEHNRDNHEMRNMSTAVAFGAMQVSDIPIVRERINEYKDSFKESVSGSAERLSEFCDNIKDSVIEFCSGGHENVNDFLADDGNAKDLASLSEGLYETRNFGITECSDAAKDIFNPGVINEWPNMTTEQRKDLAYLYANEVAKAFELENYKGVIIEQLEPGVYGYNKGDGYAHLTEDLVAPHTSPLNIIDTITHELRHQYQSEVIAGFHDVPENVRKEWAVAQAIYNYNQPNCYDPWGYNYNPLEIDSRFAGESVVRNITNYIINEYIA